MSKRYGNTGKWVCTVCGRGFTPAEIKEMDDHNHIRWTQPKAFYRDLEMYQEPKCPDCNQEMILQSG
jgi:hypothetical protein